MACVANLSSSVSFTWLIGLRDAFVVLFPQLLNRKKTQCFVGTCYSVGLRIRLNIFINME